MRPYTGFLMDMYTMKTDESHYVQIYDAGPHWLERPIKYVASLRDI